MSNFSKENKKKIKKLVETCRINKDTSWYRKVPMRRVIENKHKYFNVADKIGCPAAFVAMIHIREAGSDIGKFKKYLGNGQPLNKRTTIVPKGRGPFKNWESGAIDALKHEKIHMIKDWSLERVIFELESYNGFGYEKRNINTPYIWNFTNHYLKGQFYSDGKFSWSKKDRNIGCYAFYLDLIKEDKSFEIKSSLSKPIEQPGPEKPKEKNWLLMLMTTIFNFFKSLFKNKTESPKAEKKEEKEIKIEDFRNLKVLRLAASQLGVKEIKGKRGSSKIVEKYLDHGSRKDNKKSNLRDETPWCAGFIAWVLEKNSMGSTNSLMARSYEKWGKSVKSNPIPGDIVTFYRNGKRSGQGHVTFFIKETKNYVWGLGGNQNDEVNITRYSKNRMTDIRRSSKEKKLDKNQMAELFSLRDRILDGETIEKPISVQSVEVLNV